MNKKLRIAITHGDTNGIGYELILKTFAQPELLDLCTPIVYGSEKVAAYYRKALELDVHWHLIDRPEDALAERLNLIDVVGDEEVKIEPGRPSAEAGRMAFRALSTRPTSSRPSSTIPGTPNFSKRPAAAKPSWCYSTRSCALRSSPPTFR